MDIKKAYFIYENWEFLTVREIAKKIDVDTEEVRRIIKSYGFREVDAFPRRKLIFCLMSDFGATRENKKFLAGKMNMKIKPLTAEFNYYKKLVLTGERGGRKWLSDVRE